MITNKNNRRYLAIFSTLLVAFMLSCSAPSAVNAGPGQSTVLGIR